MRAALLKSYGGVDQFVIDDIPMPEPGAGEVLIRIEASAVNPFDLIVRQGNMAKLIPLQLPAVLGGDASGVITRVGTGVNAFSVGDRVIADFATNGRGAHAEYGVAPTTAIAKLPANLSFEQGAALPKAGLTGRETVDALGVGPGARVLVSGGLGAVGRTAIQYLQEIGAQPVAGVRPERLDEARALAGEAIDITAAPASASFDFAISTAGTVVPSLVANVRNGGRIISIVPVPDGSDAGGRVSIQPLYHRTDAHMLAVVAEAAARGALVIPIAKAFRLEQIGAAHAAVAAGSPGKVVLSHA